jgi:hypothetical protein
MMSRLSATTFGLALPFAFVSQAALADLTPTDVWGDWRQYMEGMGYVIDATETANGDDLAVSDIVFNIAMPEGAGAMSMTVGSMNFVQNDDGTVDVMMPAEMPMTINITPEAGSVGDPVMVSLKYTQSDYSLKATGSPEVITYAQTAGAFAIILEQLKVGDDTYGTDNAKVDISGTGLTSNTTMTLGEMRGYEQTSNIASIQYDIAINNPDEPATVKMKGSAADLSVRGGGVIPLILTDAADMGAMLKDGFDVNGLITYGAGTSDIEVSDPANGNFAMTTTSTGGELGVEMGAGGLAYNASQSNLAVTANVAGLPFPIEASIGKGGFNLSMPVTKSDDPQDFSFGITLADFEMSDMIWGIFDPTSQLPRDPATVVLDLTGKAKLLVDFLDPDAAAQLATDTPGELQSLTVSKIQVDAVGAKLDGTGEFTFDNTDTTTFPGMPKPIGAVDLSLAGGNALLDKLVAMGILPSDQAMGARMMMGLFGVPGTEPDTLSSKVEFTEGGQVLANGQRIK